MGWKCPECRSHVTGITCDSCLPGSKEDAVVEYLMANRHGGQPTYRAEVHYNHYGSRGVVDLIETYSELDQAQYDAFIEGGHSEKLARRVADNSHFTGFEVKSPSAIASATGANQITRQFNRHREYFFKGSEYSHSKYETVNWMLLFWGNQTARSHVKSNEALYRNLSSEPSCWIGFVNPADGIELPFEQNDIPEITGTAPLARTDGGR